MSDFNVKMHQIVCRLGLCPRPRVYSVYFVYLYILCNGPCPPPYYKIVPRPMHLTMNTCSSLSLSIIRLESRLFCLSCSITKYDVRHPQNQKYITYRNADRGPSHGHRQHARQINLVKFGHVVFELCERTDRQTDKYSSQYIGHLTRSEVTTPSVSR